MRPPFSFRAALAASVTLFAAVGLAVVGTTPAHAATPMPAHLFAPYFEAYSSDDPATVAAQSGAKYLSMAFVQTPSSGSCTVDWNGSSAQPIGSTFASSIATIRSRGGDVIPSFGGYTADTTNTEIADSCTSVSSIAAAIENVVSAYDLSRIDFDVEQNSLTNSAGIDRRNKAIAQVESWASGNGRPLQVSYTLPTNPTGLDSGGMAVMNSAVSNGARVDVVNIMTFDYYTGTSHEMATETENAASSLVNQLGSLYPSKTSAQRWAMVGVTEMPGIDDYGTGETFTTADASTVYNWAVGKGINEISMWASERDNGGCPGTAGSDTCSGISQPQWYFSNTWEPFTSGGSVANDFSVKLAPSSGSVTAGSSVTSSVSTAVVSGSAESVALSASGLPAGATASFNPTSVTAGSGSTLTIATGSSTPAGTYSVTVTGSAASGSHSATFTLTVSSAGGGGCTSAQLLGNPGFENGATITPWTESSTLGFNPITQASSSEPAHSGSWEAWMNGNGSADTDTIAQAVSIPSGCTAALSFWLHADTTENTTTAKPDTFTVQVLNSSGTVLGTVASFSNLDHNTGYTQHTYDVSAYAGQAVTVKFTGKETDTNGGTTTFVIDDTALKVSGGTVANDFSISLAPTSGSVTAGASATVTASTTVTSGSAQSVTLSASALPSGASASFSPAPVTAGGSSTLTIATASTTPAGTYTVTVTGTAASGSHTATYTLAIAASGGGGCTAAQLLGNPGFENGSTTAPWTQSSTLGFNPITQGTSSEPAHSGTWEAWMNGNGSADTDTIAQSVTVPTGCKASLSFWLHADTTENTTTAKPDTFTVQALNTSGAVLSTVASFTNLNHNTGYTQHTYDLSAYAGQTITLKFTGKETDANGGTTTFVIDDTAVQTS